MNWSILSRSSGQKEEQEVVAAILSESGEAFDLESSGFLEVE